ncbi:MAG: PaaI family thioesterase [Thermodesulfovibrionales bacterium]
MTAGLIDDGYCFVCGKSNPNGLKVEFKNTANGVTAEFSAGKNLQGYKDIVHGGIIATLLDEASVKALLSKGIRAVTAEITLRFKNPLFINENAIINADIGHERGKLFEIDAEIRKIDGEIIAQSRAKLFRHEE